MIARMLCKVIGHDDGMMEFISGIDPGAGWPPNPASYNKTCRRCGVMTHCGGDARRPPPMPPRFRGDNGRQS